MTETIHSRIAQEVQAQGSQVTAAIQLLDDGATVPFIARYRKEVTGGLDDVQLRKLEERLTYLRELEDRRGKILESIVQQGKLTDGLAAKIRLADTKTRLEDLYLPYKVKRRTKAQIARERGLAPLAQQLLEDPGLTPETVAGQFVDPVKEVPDATAALDGARQILMEQFAEDAELLGSLREYVWGNAQVRASVTAGKEVEGAKFRDYFDHNEPLSSVPSHRALAMLRARKEGVIGIKLVMDVEDDSLGADTTGTGRVCKQFGIAAEGRPADKWLVDSARLCWRAKISLHIETELVSKIREAAEKEAILVFANNLKDLLLAAPAGPKTILGLDPGLRTGVKVVVVDATGKVLATDTVYPTPPRNDWIGASERLKRLISAHDVQLISIGNGTGSRETDRLAAELVKAMPERKITKLVVSEAGASIYSASELASKELPDLDVSLRGAVSIARRLQDPLAELVKIEPKSIGVGQYQHDVNQVRLGRGLEAVVEDCVNAVGVDVNTASPALLARVAGLSTTIAENIVEYRNQNGAFKNRKQILKVARLGQKAFEQAAGFLRIMEGDNPLDRSAVHPEAYPVVERITTRSGRDVRSLIGDQAFLRALKPADFTDETFGVPTVVDIIAELEKPGRDPRPEFETASFQDGVEEISDLQLDMVLEGVVTNVTNFGAFVDIGVHQDGLVHISQLAEKFIEDPRDVVKAGQVVKVKVMNVDQARKRVALSMRLGDQARDHEGGRGGSSRSRGGDTRPAGGQRSGGQRSGGQRSGGQRSDGQKGGSERGGRMPREEPAGPNAFARAFASIKKSDDKKS